MLFARSGEAQQFNPQVLLDAAKSKIASTVEQAARFTCTESVERQWYENAQPEHPGCDTDRTPKTVRRNLVRSDRLRLDVGVGSDQEIFSWHGEDAFQSDEIDKVVTSGPVNSGTFFSFLSSIFLEGLAQIDYRGLENDNGKHAALFGYSVPIRVSKFETRTSDGSAPMGYHGQFTVDVSSQELKTLTVETDDMPSAAHICGFRLDLQYTTVAINGWRLQLPLRAAMDVLNPSHQRITSSTQYAQCREFHSESALRFDGGSSPTEKRERTAPLRLAAGLRLQIRIDSDINPQTAWAGDAVEGSIAADVVDQQGHVLIRKDTPVEGRLVRVESWERPARFYTVEIQFERLTTSAHAYLLHLRSMPPEPEQHSSLGRLRQRVYLYSPPSSERLDTCRFRINGRNSNLKGAVTFWITD